jgi:uncharacterized cupredoxin-like copper-binding protein
MISGDEGGSGRRREQSWREWMMVALGLVALLAILAIVSSIAAIATGRTDPAAGVPAAAAAPAQTPDGAGVMSTVGADDPAAKGVDFEPFERVDPDLPAVPTGKVKRFDVDVYHHVTKVHEDMAPTEVWSYEVNGVQHRGTGYSSPMVVEVGDTVDFKLTNGSNERMKVTLPHSMDFHSAKVDPGRRYADLAPGKSMRYRFVTKHPGVFMYHCATKPVLMHTGMGMVGAMVVKPKGLAPARDLMVTQQEFYIGAPGKGGDMAKMEAKQPSAITFNGFADQYAKEPISVRKGERIRMWVLNAGPSIWSAFHVIGTIFDRTMIEGVEGSGAQTVNLAPSQGGYVEFTLDEEGTYPFVTHAFGDAIKGAIGVLKTTNAPEGGGHDMGRKAEDDHSDHDHGAKADVNVELGDMFVKADTTEVKAGKRTFAIENTGATMHGMAFALQPVDAKGGMLEDGALLNKGKELMGGERETMTVDLKPGEYEIVCFVPGHYAAGQKLAFTVT